MDAELADAKRRLRGEMGALRRDVVPEAARAAGRAVAALLTAEPAVTQAARVGLYAALADELPTRDLFEALAGRTPLLLPRIDGERLEFQLVERWDELEPGRFGVLEPGRGTRAPVDLGPGDVLILPGVAFDRAGNRLGRGGGFYDRALAGASPPPLRIGAAYAFQLVASVPHDSRDRPVDAIVTERELCFLSGRK